MDNDFRPILHRVLQRMSDLEIREIRRFQAERFVFTVQTNKSRHKIFQVIFERDGSLYVTLPYFDIKEGIVSMGTLPITYNKTNIHLEEKGKVTSNRVKYSHRPDGNIHFSQTGKVKSEIRKKSLPLTATQGHLFSVNAQGLHHFETDPVEKNHMPTLKRTVLNFDFREDPIKAIKFAAWWYQDQFLLNRSPNKRAGPTSTAIMPVGKRIPTFFVGPPQGWTLSDHVLVISCEAIEKLDKNGDGVLNFIGGFSQPSKGIVEIPSFLCLNYPIPNYAELADRIGSIDL